MKYYSVIDLCLYVDSPNKRQCLQDLNTLSPSRNIDKLSKPSGPTEDHLGMIG